MATSRRGTNFKEFAATLRYPPIQIENQSSDPLATPRAQFLKDFAVNVLNDVLKDLKEEGLEQYANEYNKHPFKSYLEKVKEDESLKNPVNKAAKAALVNESNLQAGDPFAEAIYDIIDSFTDNVTLDKDGVFGKTENSARAREELLAAMGVNSVKLLGFIALSSLARSIPIEQITQYNVQQYLQFLDPVFLLEKLISGIKNQSISNSINDFKLVGRFINGVLTSSQFESKVQKAFLDYIAEQPDLPPALREIASFDEIIFITNPDNINESSDEDTFRAVSTITFDLLQNGKLGIDIKLVSKDLQGNVLGEISLNNLSDQMTGLVTGAQEDLQSIFDLLESCELPDADMFNKYRKTSVAVGQFFKGFKPIRLGKTKKGKIKIPDRHEIVEAALVSALVSSFYVATATLFKLVLQYLQKLVPDLSCAQISGMLVPEETLGPRTQNAAVDPLQAARIIANNLKDNPASVKSGIKIDDVAAILAEIANSIGLFNGVDIASLNEFVSLTISILTQREFCELISGTPTGEVITLVQNVIEIKFPNAGISKVPEDIIRFFSSISTMVDPGCEAILDTIDLPVNTILCATPEYYRLYNDLRIALLRERGLSDQDIEVQINKVCELNNRQIQQFLDLLNNDDPLNSMIPLIQTGDPNCGPETSLGPAMDVIKPELIRSYKAIFDPLRESLDNNIVGASGFISTVLSAKNGLPFPIYLKIAKLTSESYDQAQLMAGQSQLAMSARIDAVLNPGSDNLMEDVKNLVVLDYDPSLLSIEPKKVASWLRLNQEEFCSLAASDRMLVTPLSLVPTVFRNPIQSLIMTDEELERILYIAGLRQSDVTALTFADDILDYNDFYGKTGLGNPNSMIRMISYSGMSDPRQNTIGNLSFDGIRQLNLKSGALREKVVLNPQWAYARVFSLVHPFALVQTIASKIFGGSDPYVNSIEKKIEVADASNNLKIPGITKVISANTPAYRIKSYNFFVFPFEDNSKGTGTIVTKIFDYLPANLEALNDRGVVRDNALTVEGSYQYQESYNLRNSPQVEFSKTRKSYELLEIHKKSDDYHIPMNSSNLSTDIVDSLPNRRASGEGSTRSKVFANIVLQAIRDNVGIGMDEIPDVSEYSDYLQKDLYNYVYNSYLDSIVKIPAYNGKNLSFGISDQRVNTLNSLHVNTITGEPDPVAPEDFDGSEIDPSIYFYNKLSDDWKNLYNIYIRDRNTEVTPARTPVPDFEGFAERASDLYLKIQEETRESIDYSNQFPFDLIVSKSSLVTMDSLIDMMIKVFCFEHYYKAFPVLNPFEISDNVLDNVYFDFLAKRFKLYAGRASPNASRRRQKSNKFYHMLMEMYVSILIKKKDAKLLNAITLTTQDAINQITRKSNIWRLGVPSTNLTDKESTYLNAVSVIVRYEVPGYPLGTISSGIAASQGAIGPVNRIYEDAKKKRSEQVRLRNDFWNRIMEDCEPIFESLLQERFKAEMTEISRQLSILNPDLLRENSILNMPINGGPIMQNDEKIPSPDGTAYMRNVYTHHPLSMYSAGNSLISEKGYRSYYGTEENNNDRNMNGFLFTSLYNKQPHSNNTVLLNNNPKEPVYKYSTISDGADFESNIRAAFQDFDPRRTLSGKEKMDFAKYSPDFLTPSLLNFIELQKRNIITNNFLLDTTHTKADTNKEILTDLIAFQDDAKELERIQADIDKLGGNVRISDVLLATPSNPNQSLIGGERLDLEESKYGSLKRYKIISTEGSEFRKVGIDSFVVGGESASNMPLIFSQVPIPFINEQFINLEPLDTAENPNLAGISTDAYIDSVTGENLIENTRYNLERVLYDSTLFDARTFGQSIAGTQNFETLASGIFTGPSSLTTLVYWLGSSGFLSNAVVGSKSVYSDYNNVGGITDFLDFPIKWFFKPGTFRYGVRIMLLQPDSNLSISDGLHEYLEKVLLPEPTPSDAVSNLRERIKNQKVLLKENGYGIPLFREEKEVDWTFRDLKNIYDTYLANLIEETPTSLGFTKASAKWIDHTPLTRFTAIELFGNIVCSDKYKTLFDYCIPLRYFTSLSAIYSTKGFVESIGSAIDWNGVKTVNPRAFSRRESDVLLPFYQAVRKVFYYSYNSFDPFYLGEGDDEEDLITAEASKDFTHRPSIIMDRGESIQRLSEIQSNILKANEVDPLFRENLGDLRNIVGYGYQDKIVPDPSNGDGNVTGS
jgi:hypothetical protein